MINLLNASKKDKKWRMYALKLTGEKDEANEVVQEMYIKLSKVKNEVNDSYIFMMINSVFLDRKKKKKRLISLDDDCISFIENKMKSDEDFEVNENQKNKIDKLPFHQKQLLIESYDKSLRQIQKEFNINYGFVYRELKKAKKTVLENG